MEAEKKSFTEQTVQKQSLAISTLDNRDYSKLCLGVSLCNRLKQN